MHLELVRWAYLDDMTLGRLKTPEFELATLERPWAWNPAGPGGEPGASCVPDGRYRLLPHDSEEHRGVYALENAELGVYLASRPGGQAWGRTEILIHVANRVRELLGCIAVGLKHGRLAGERAVLSSAEAMERLAALLGRVGEHRLTIRATRGTMELEH